MKRWFDILLVGIGITTLIIVISSVVTEAIKENTGILTYIIRNLPDSLVFVSIFILGIIFIVLGLI